MYSDVGLEEIPDTADDNKFYEAEEIINVRLQLIGSITLKSTKCVLEVMSLIMTCRFRFLLSDFNFNFKLSQREEEYVNTILKMNVTLRSSEGNDRSSQMQ